MSLKTTKILSNQTIWDISNNVYGGFDNIITLIQLNPDLESIDADLQDFATDTLSYDSVYYVSRTPQLQLNTPTITSSIKQVSGQSNQSIYDLVLDKYGDLGMMVKFIQDNENLSSINDLNVVGKTFNFDSDENKSGALKAVIEKRGYVFASLFEDRDTSEYRVTTSLEIRLTTANEVRVTT